MWTDIPTIAPLRIEIESPSSTPHDRRAQSASSCLPSHSVNVRVQTQGPAHPTARGLVQSAIVQPPPRCMAPLQDLPGSYYVRRGGGNGRSSQELSGTPTQPTPPRRGDGGMCFPACQPAPPPCHFDSCTQCGLWLSHTADRCAAVAPAPCMYLARIPLTRGLCLRPRGVQRNVFEPLQKRCSLT